MKLRMPSRTIRVYPLYFNVNELKGRRKSIDKSWKFNGQESLKPECDSAVVRALILQSTGRRIAQYLPWQVVHALVPAPLKLQPCGVTVI